VAKKRITATGVVSNHPVRTRTIGIDVDSAMLVVAFLDIAASQVPILEFPNTDEGQQALLRKAQEFQPEIIVLESTGQYSLPVYDALAPYLFTVVVNPSAIKALLRADGAKTDKLDALTLARCGAMFPRLRWSNMPDAWQRETRLHVRMYDEAQQTRIQASARLVSQLRQYNCDVTQFGSLNSAVRWNILRALGKNNSQLHLLHPQKRRQQVLEAMFRNLELPDAILEYRDCALEVIDAADATLRRETEWLLNRLEEPDTTEAARWMRTVPCSPDIIVIRALAEFGRNFTQRYPTASAFCAAAGVAPRNEITGGHVVKLSETPGRKAFLTQFTSALKGHLINPALQHEIKLWLGSYERRGASYSRRLLALAHLIGEGWYNCTKLQCEWSAHEAVGHRLDKVIDTRTGEILYRAKM